MSHLGVQVWEISYKQCLAIDIFVIMYCLVKGVLLLLGWHEHCIFESNIRNIFLSMYFIKSLSYPNFTEQENWMFKAFQNEWINSTVPNWWLRLRFWFAFFSYASHFTSLLFISPSVRHCSLCQDIFNMNKIMCGTISAAASLKSIYSALM